MPGKEWLLNIKDFFDWSNSPTKEEVVPQQTKEKVKPLGFQTGKENKVSLNYSRKK